MPTHHHTNGKARRTSPWRRRPHSWIAAAGILLGGFARMAPALPAQEIQVIPAASVDRTLLRPPDLAVLDQPRFRWEHLQTERFVLHHDQPIFAYRVARMAEEFYGAIAADLPRLRDRVSPRRSHIFIFRDERDWKTVVSARPGLEPWAASFVAGNTLYLQKLGQSTADKMGLLAHEMAHLVFNRFLPVALPMWLNEGLAEYYEEFAFRASKGMGQSRRSAFPPLRSRTPLAELLAATAYPSSPAEVTRFYATSKYLVGYLLMRQPREKWEAFLARVLAGDEASAALLETYGWADIPALEREFSRFSR